MVEKKTTDPSPLNQDASWIPKNIKGLTAKAIQVEHAVGRTNKVQKETSRTVQGIILSNLLNVFNLIIFSIAAILVILYFVFGDKRTLYDSLAISAVAIINSIISIFQELRAKAALDAIEALSRSMSSVYREGRIQDIPMDDLVTGDVVLIKRGDQIPVDGTILYSRHCEVDESLLTGESEYIFKDQGDAVRSGSFCVAGRALLRAEKIGKESYIHKLAKEVRSYKRFVSPLQRSIDRLVEVMIALAAILGFLVIGRAVAEYMLKSGVLAASLPATLEGNTAFRDIAIETTRSVASIVTSMIPVGLILLSTVAFALGVFRISRQGALIQKLNAIESFAHIDTLCMDKTGTLTKNELKLHKLAPLAKDLDEETMRALLGAFAHKATDQNATLVAIAASCPLPAETQLHEEIPFNSKEKYSGLVLSLPLHKSTTPKDNTQQHRWLGKKLSLVIGAFERLRERFSPEEQEKASALLAERQGQRNLILAALPEEQTLSLREAMKQGAPLALLGVISLVDEMRPDIEAVLGRFQERGIRLKLISGDAPETVQAVARAAGWQEETHHVVVGSDLDRMTQAQLHDVASRYSLFARVSPQNKKDLISALQAQKRYVAMVGDGVNDVLALKQAELGVAMESGNRMSRDVSDIVLFKDNFSILPEVLAEGETIIGNVQSSAKLFLTKNVYAAILILATGFLGLAFPFVPRHVTIIGFFSISVPALLITMTKRMRDVPPHFLRDVLRFTSISGAMIAGSALIAYFASLVVWRQSVETARVALLTQIVLLSLLNFLIIIGREEMFRLLRENWELSAFALGFAAVYFLLLFVVTGIPALGGLASFLELKALSSKELLLAFILTPLVGTAMLLTHRHLLRQDRLQAQEDSE
jgi:cation-transporting ATPase E